MKVAWLFPGQGVNLAGMVSELPEQAPTVQNLLDEALARLGLTPGDLLARGGRVLEATDVFQPVLTAFTVGISLVLKSRAGVPDVVAGHSLGEIAAWTAAGGLTPQEAVRIAAERGRLMARWGRGKGGMLAVRVKDRHQVLEVLKLGRQEGRIRLAAENAADEWVLAGEAAALRAIAGAYPATSLPIAGPWHGPGLEGCVPEWRDFLSSVSSAPLSTTYLSNRTGRVVSDPRLIPRLLVEQMTQPVLWARTMKTLLGLETTDVVTVGPGKILRHLARKNGLAHVRYHSTERVGDLRRTLEVLTP